MPDVSRKYCTRCGESVYNCIIDGVRVPLVCRIVVGQPEDTGPRLAMNGPGVKVPSFVRELMASPLPRMELCVACTAVVFGVPLVEASADPLVGADVDGVVHPDDVEHAELEAMPMVQRRQLEHARALEAIHIGRGDPQAKAVTTRPPKSDPRAQASEVARLKAENDALRKQLAAAPST